MQLFQRTEIQRLRILPVIMQNRIKTTSLIFMGCLLVGCFCFVFWWYWGLDSNLLGRCSTTWGIPPKTPGWPGLQFSYLCFLLARMTGAPPHPDSIGWGGWSFMKFCLKWPQTAVPLISTFQGARTIGMSHHAWKVLFCCLFVWHLLYHVILSLWQIPELNKRMKGLFWFTVFRSFSSWPFDPVALGLWSTV
jgi:hypothetical protein